MKISKHHKNILLLIIFISILYMILLVHKTNQDKILNEKFILTTDNLDLEYINHKIINNILKNIKYIK
jgi:cell division protein FtsL